MHRTANSKGKHVIVKGQDDELDLSTIDANSLVANGLTLGSKFAGVAGRASRLSTHRTPLFHDRQPSLNCNNCDRSHSGNFSVTD